MPRLSKRLNWLYILFIFSWPLLVNLLSVVHLASASMLDGWSSPVQINDGPSTNANSPAIAVMKPLTFPYPPPAGPLILSAATTAWL